LVKIVKVVIAQHIPFTVCSTKSARVTIRAQVELLTTNQTSFGEAEAENLEEAGDVSL